MEKTTRRYFTFYWHEEGMDYNGNYGPNATDPGWHAVAAEAHHKNDYESGLEACPEHFRKRVMRIVRKHLKENGGCSQGCDLADDECMFPLQHFIADTAGWGNGFSFLGEGEWENKLDLAEADHDALLHMEAEGRILGPADRARPKQIHEFDNK